MNGLYNLDRLATQYAKEYGEACEHLFDPEIYSKLGSTHEKKVYVANTYRIQCFINNSEEKIFQVNVKCLPCNIEIVNIFKCKKTFPKTEAKILDIFLKSGKDLKNLQ